MKLALIALTSALLWVGGVDAATFQEPQCNECKVCATAEPRAKPTDGSCPPCPTESPTSSPVAGATDSPTASPSLSPTASPSAGPTVSPTAGPSASPTASPTAGPSASPTAGPTASPSVSPTAGPTKGPSASPTASPTASPSVSPTVSPTASPTASPSKSPVTTPTTASPTVSPTASPTKSPESGTTTTGSCPYTKFSTGTTVWTWTQGSEVPLTGKNIDVGDGPFAYTTVTKQGNDVPVFGTAGKTATVKMGCGADVDNDDELEGAGVMCQGFTVGQSGKNTCSGTPNNELLGDPGTYDDDTRFYCAIGGDTSKIACFQLKSSATSMSTVQIQVGCDEALVKSDGCWDNYVEVGLTVWDYKAAPGAMVTYYEDGYTTGIHTFTTYESKSLSHIGACVTEMACPGGGTTTTTTSTTTTSSPTVSPTASPSKSPEQAANSVDCSSAPIGDYTPALELDFTTGTQGWTGSSTGNSNRVGRSDSYGLYAREDVATWVGSVNLDAAAEYVYVTYTWCEKKYDTGEKMTLTMSSGGNQVGSWQHTKTGSSNNNVECEDETFGPFSVASNQIDFEFKGGADHHGEYGYLKKLRLYWCGSL